MLRIPFLLSAALLLAVPAAAEEAKGLPVGACINMGNSLETMVESQDGKRIDAADFARIRAAGFTTVRIPVRWMHRSRETAPHTIDPAFLDRVEAVVDQALAADLNVILNSHHFDALDKDPAATAPWLAAVWKQVAARFAARPEARLWFEISNEPHDKLTNANLLATLAPALAAIRATNPTRAVVIGGENWSGIDSLATLDLPDDPNVYPTFHYYEPFDFTHQGATWVDPSPPLGRLYGTQADADRLAADVEKIRRYIARTGRKPFIGETGAYEAIPLAGRVQYHRAVHDAFAPLDLGICAWAYTNTFPFWDRKTEQWLPGLRAAFGLPENEGESE